MVPNQDITFCDGESLDSSLLYCGHLSFMMRLILHLTAYYCEILTMRSRQQVVIVYPSCIRIRIITCQALLEMDSSGLVSNDARPYP